MWPQRHKQERQASADESPSARELRYLLRTAPMDPLRAVIRDGIAALPVEHRQEVLDTIQRQLVSGARLTPDHVDEIARLATLGERRSPGAVVRHLPPDVLERLASSVVPAARATGLTHGYAEWDGVDPVVVQSTAETYPSGFDSERHYGIVKGRADSGFST